MSIIFECKKKAEVNNSQSSIESLVINNSSMKTDYILGDTLDLTGIQIQVILGPLTIDVTQYCTFNPTNGTVLTSDITSITATFLGVSGSTPINVYEVDEIAVTTQPTKTQYASGETLDFSGLVVTGYANNGSITSNITSQCTLSPANGSTVSGEDGTYSVSVTYGNLSTSFSYTISSIPATLNDCTWAQIKEFANAGTLLNYYSIGDTKQITIGGKTMNVRLADMNTGVATNPVSGANVGQYYPNGTADFITDGFVDTGVTAKNRFDLMWKSALATIYNGLSSDLKNVIVQKTIGDDSGYAEDKLYTGHLWVPTGIELGAYNIGNVRSGYFHNPVYSKWYSQLFSTLESSWKSNWSKQYGTDNVLYTLTYYKSFPDGMLCRYVDYTNPASGGGFTGTRVDDANYRNALREVLVGFRIG